MEKADESLLPCPWCRGHNLSVGLSDGVGNISVHCFDCGMSGPSSTIIHRAKEAWNKLPRGGGCQPGSADPTLNGLDCKPCNNGEKSVADTLADRQQDYGDAKESFDRIASLWNIWLAGKATVAAHDVAMMMVLFKVAREKHKTKDDNLVDIGGYAELARRL